MHLVASDDVAWHLGEPIAFARGGRNASGLQTTVPIHPVVAQKRSDRHDLMARVPNLSNPRLFARDCFMCMYCGQRFPARALSRDHVRPVSAGGPDTWENVVTACTRCNHRKGHLSLEQAGMSLLAVPYAPNHAERLLLEGRRVLADQMQFLIGYVPSSRRDRWERQASSIAA